MLTHKQHELLLFIHQCISESGIPPSFDEMKEAVDIASKSGIHRLIVALEERGFIRRLPNRARALEIIKLPPSLVPDTVPFSGTSATPHLKPKLRLVGGGIITHNPVETFALKGDFIQLIQLLKAMNWVENGAMAQHAVAEGMVKCNGRLDYRKRLKVRAGDLVEFGGKKVEIVYS